MRKALLVGINEYPTAPLKGCVNDARRVGQALSRNWDGSPNLDCRYILAPSDTIERHTLSQAVKELFSSDVDVALFYFSGHGAIEVPGGYLMTPDAKTLDDGYPMRDLLAHATQSRAHEVVIILDCCHSGQFGSIAETDSQQAHLREGLAVLAACRSSETSLEENGAGVFTTLVCDALDGGAADVLGHVTVGSIYAYVDLALSAWDQRPVFKAHLSKFTPLRQCKPHVDAAILRLLPSYFSAPDEELSLDPSYEPSVEPNSEKNERTFAHLQELRDARLLVPVGEKHLYYAAVHSKACKLTTLGQFYWQLAKRGRI